jgi:hypothetical protein
VITHWDKHIRDKFVDLGLQVKELVDFINKKGYEGRKVTVKDVLKTLPDWCPEEAK